MSNEWTIVKYGKQKPRAYNMYQNTYVLPVLKKDPKQFKTEQDYMSYLETYLKRGLPNYGNFKNVLEATYNLYMNMHLGLTPVDMSEYEKTLLEFKYGRDWKVKLGY